MSENNKKIAERVISLRNELRMNQKQMAEKLNISQQLISYYEKGLRTLPVSILEKYVEKFGLNYQWLLKGEGQMFDMEKINKQMMNAVLDDNNFEMSELALKKWKEYTGQNKINESKKEYVIQSQTVAVSPSSNSIETIALTIETLEEKQQQKIFLKLMLSWQIENLNRMVKIMTDIIEFKEGHKKE